MFKISTTLALAALISVSTLSSADASYVWDQQQSEHKLRSGNSYYGTHVVKRYVQEDRDESVFDNTDRRSSEYSLSRDEIYGQPSSSGYRGTSIGYSDGESFWSKNKGKIILGATFLTSALLYTAVKFMSYTNPEEQDQNNNPAPMYSGMNDPVLNMAADLLVEQASNSEVTQTIASSIVNVASSFFAPFSNVVFGSNN